MKIVRKYGLQIIGVIAGLIILNFLSGFFYKRFDLTQDKRYTLSEATNGIVNSIDKTVVIDVLLEGDFPPEFRKLQTETRQLLEELSARNNRIKFDFVDPLEGSANREQTINQLQGLGLTPARVTVEESARVSQELVFPWAIANLGEKSVRISLLKNKLGATPEERVNNSVQQLEYVFTEALHKLSLTEKKKIAILKGNGELDDLYMADFLNTIRDSYSIAPFTLDSVARTPQKTLAQLQQYDLAIIAKPTEAFSEEEKYVLDQYHMQGGKSVWMLDQVVMELDSLFANKGNAIAVPRNLNLNDFFFKYGVRINPELISDLYFTQIVIATGSGNASQYNPVPWLYNPMVISKNNHAINNNIEAVRMQFVSPIDTLANTTRKTILLQSSPLSKTEGVPKQISLSSITREPDKDSFNKGNIPLAVLLEGSFSSAYRNRVKPLKLNENKDQGNTAMVVISDGDIIKNQLQNGRPLELGYDKWTNNFYGNKEFLLNVVNFLLDDSGLINIRNKKVNVAFLDVEKTEGQKTRWQFINLALPLAFFGLLSFVYSYFRRKKYTE